MANPEEITTLGIESSCDDTAVSILRGREVLSERISSQTEHSRFGGVVPEFAARMHQEAILPLIQSCIDESKSKVEKIDLIAVTHGPGLMGSLLVGVMTARALSFTWDIPVIGVNHIEGHIFANFINGIEPPFLCLVVSGGHTEIIRVEEWGNYSILGATRDDAAGEAFDKGAKLLNLGYPGGIIIDKLSASGDPLSFDFPIPLKNTSEVEFSFSGLKTALLWKTKEFGDNIPLEDICASYQRAIVESLITKTELAVAKTGISRVAISGGVAANSELRRALERKRKESGWEVFTPAVKYCTDNAVMIAAAGANAWSRGERNIPIGAPSVTLG